MGEIKWMQGNRYGVMVHYLSDIQPQKGPGFGNWDEMTEAFNIIDFANEIEKMGAGWLFFRLDRIRADIVPITAIWKQRYRDAVPEGILCGSWHRN